MELTFSNPRTLAEFNDWPLGGNKRGRCVFKVERNKRGYRVSRQTTGKPKFDTYGGLVAIVDGSNGKTYILQVATPFKFIKISRSDFMNAAEANGGSVHETDPDYQPLMELILAGGSFSMPVQ